MITHRTCSVDCDLLASAAFRDWLAEESEINRIDGQLKQLEEPAAEQYAKITQAEEERAGKRTDIEQVDLKETEEKQIEKEPVKMEQADDKQAMKNQAEQHLVSKVKTMPRKNM